MRGFFIFGIGRCSKLCPEFVPKNAAAAGRKLGCQNEGTVDGTAK